MSQATSHSRGAFKIQARWIVLAAIVVAALAAALLHQWWLPPLKRLAATGLSATRESAEESAATNTPSMNMPDTITRHMTMPVTTTPMRSR